MNPQSADSDTPCSLARPLGSLSGWQERRAKELMLRDMDNCVRIGEIAQQCNLSRSHFSRAFKKVTGHSPQDWLLRMKIEKAKRLLITSMAITDVVYECGFADHPHFTRTFSRLEGVTPKAWRHNFHHAIASSHFLSSADWRERQTETNPGTLLAVLDHQRPSMRADH
ncbi:helix-turn-helix transcriptional regulator [Pseudomonas sp. PDM31]|uniref:helix-turn-helix transcriptional regulator n=1 Tax=Pseudomonas sp. PDM31 TaxID=2854778 RepID=UPI001C43E892|nr:AraC family transcriptional regulator [Pseudomonas sp. PDM31]MBV7476589.1 AraC family transcriptional regulator [Pseudomonas sp. PDM31]